MLDDGYAQGFKLYPIALSGRVPVKISPTSEEIKQGDLIGPSSELGKARKVSEGFIVGRALETWNPGRGQKTIKVFVNPIFVSNLAEVNEAGDIKLAQDLVNPGYYQIQDKNGNLVTKLSGLTNFIVDNIKAGAIEATNITVSGGQFIAENIKAGYAEIASLVSPSIKTSEIKSLDGERDIAIQIGTRDESLGTSGFGKLLVKNRTGEIVASVDEVGNATFSGQLASESLKTNDASIAGELRADRIVANDIVGLDTMTREEIEALLREAESGQGLLS